jgi:hypothetical protein
MAIPSINHQKPGPKTPWRSCEANGRGVFIHQGRDKYVDPEVVAKMEEPKNQVQHIFTWQKLDIYIYIYTCIYMYIHVVLEIFVKDLCR